MARNTRRTLRTTKKATTKEVKTATAKASTKAKPTARTKAKPQEKPAARARTTPSGDVVVAALDKLRGWARAGGTLEASAPKDDEAQRLKAPQPEWGTISWQLPPSYRAFVAQHSRLQISWGENIGHDEFVILSPKEMRETGGIVYMPADVSRDPGRYLSTNHLVPFASGGNDECAFCFDVTAAGPTGEYPVYYHHQDEPRARYKDGGAWEDAASATPDFPDFAAWLRWVAGELAAGREPEGSSPTAFFNMPGRAKASGRR